MRVFFCHLFLFVFLFGSPLFAQEVDQQFHGFNLQGYTDGGEKSWDVNGDKANIKGETIEITNVDANQYGDQKVNLKAKTGIIDKVTGNIHLEKDVVITTTNQGQLSTNSLDWQKEKDLVSTEDPVRIKDKGLEATGTGLTAKPGLKSARLAKDVTVNVQTTPEKKEGSVVTITCDGPMEIDQQDNKAIFHDNVVAIQDDKILKADKMEVHFNTDTMKIEQTVCSGNVEISQGENKTYSQKAIYSAIDKKLVLSGKPKLIMVTQEEGGLTSLK